MPSELIQELKEKDIDISFAKGKLKYTGPEEFIDENLLDRLRRNKKKLLKHFWPEKCWNMMPINTEGDKIPLVLIHGGPANYPISDFLGKDRPFYGYFYIGSDGEKIRYKNLEAFADEYLTQLINILPDGPCYLGGMSFGGHMAYEIAIRLQKMGREVPILFIIDAGLPDDKSDLPALPFSKRIYELLKKVYYISYDLTWKFIFRMLTSFSQKIPADTRNRYIRWTYKEYIKKYNPSKGFKGKMVILRADQNNSKHKYLGWEKYVENIELITFKGDHGSMYHNVHSVDTIKKHIEHWIKQYEESMN